MDHKDFVAALPPDLKTQLTSKSNRRGLTHLAGHAALILLLATLIATKAPGWWLLLPLQGIALIFLFTLEHETTHKTPFSNTTLNDWVGRLCGFLILLPFEWFRYFHLGHHRWTNIQSRDPELLSPKPETRAAWVWHVSGVPYWLSQIRLLARIALGGGAADYLPTTALPRIRREVLAMIIGYALAAASLFWTSTLFWVWLLPILLGQPALRLFLLAEHGDCPTVANMFENTRTTFTTKAISFLAWNMPYHTEHHVYPAVPFHQLPTLHALMKQELRVTADGYAEFTKEYLARRR
jgi:fatty acid desaturase